MGKGAQLVVDGGARDTAPLVGMSRKGARTLVARMASKSSVLVFSSGAFTMMPALLTRMSSPPSPLTSRTSVLIESSRVRSQTRTSPEPTASSSSISALVPSSEEDVRPTRTTSHPRDASLRETVLPIPDPAPVTRALSPLISERMRASCSWACGPSFPARLRSSPIVVDDSEHIFVRLRRGCGPCVAEITKTPAWEWRSETERENSSSLWDHVLGRRSRVGHYRDSRRQRPAFVPSGALCTSAI